ncbi:MAG: hypothetical protein IH933_10205 [Euryarchaeota archaeon]|nr:hypothetical protein [Euryarchaeota archaeon]
MGAINSLSTAVTTLRENPVILVGGLFFAIFGELSVFAQFAGPFAGLGLTVFWILLWPFVLAGFIGLVHAGLDGETSVGRFFSTGRSNYLSMLGATVAFFVLFGTIVAGAVIFAAIAAVGAGGTGLAIVTGAVIVFLPAAVLYVFLQFYDTGVVISDTGAIGAFSHSAGLVRRNFLSVIGYSILFWLLSFAPRLPDMALFFLAVEFPDPEAGQGSAMVVSEPLFVLSVVLGLTLGTLAIALAWTYHVVYYRSILPEPAGIETENGVDSEPF